MKTESNRQILSPRSPMPMPRLWDYLDYRTFLRAYYEARKRQSSGFSFRIFSQKTGVNSPNYMKLIIDGERNLTRTHASRVARYLGLGPEETAYFLALVRWNQCADKTDADPLWEAVLRLRAQEPSQALPTAQLSISTRWHLVALLELVRWKDFNHDPQWIRDRLRMPLTDEQIADSLRWLEQSGIIEQKRGRYRVTSRNFKTPDDVPSACLRQYHRRVIEEAATALFDTELSRREYVSTTLAIRSGDIPELKEEIRRFRDRLLALADRVEEPNEIVQFNMQLFPLTKSNGGNA